MPTPMSFPAPGPDLDSNRQGISRSLALGRILHFEALMRRRMGEVRPQRYVRLHNYYIGQNLPPDNVEQPLQINYFKQIVDKHTSYLFGQWKDRLFSYRVTPQHKDQLQAQEAHYQAKQAEAEAQAQQMYQSASGQEGGDGYGDGDGDGDGSTGDEEGNTGVTLPDSGSGSGGGSEEGAIGQELVEGELPAEEMDVDLGSPSPMAQAEEYAKRIKFFLGRLFDANDMNTTTWQAAKNGSLFGDSIFKIYYDDLTRQVKIDSVLPEYFHAMWRIDDMRSLTEVIIAYPIDRVDALERYETAGNDQFIGYQAINPHYLPGIGIYWERWSQTSFQVWIDDVNVINAPNPYMQTDGYGNLYPGIIPFIHIPNMQAGSEYWGYGDAEAVLYLQDELNRRLSDMGDVVNNHAHPIVTLRQFTGDVNDLPVGPDAVWDLGREGEAERLDGRGPAPEVMDYIQKVQDVMYDTSSMPPSAFGSHKGGTSHQSGLALSMAMIPVVERAREKRIRWTAALRKLARMAIFILAVRDPYLLADFGLNYMETLKYDLEPVWADILPKDRLEQVNEYVARSANLLTSLETALAALGEDDVASEIARIKSDAQFKAGLGAQVPGASGTAGKNSEQGQGGAAGIPGAIGANAGKPGAQIKAPGLQLDSSDSVGISSQPGF